MLPNQSLLPRRPAQRPRCATRVITLGSLLLAIAISPSTSLAAGHAADATLRLKVPPPGEFGLARIFVPIKARPGARLPRHLSFKVVNAARLRGRYGASLKVLATGSLARGLRIRHHRVYAGVVAVLRRGAGATRTLGGGLNLPPDEIGLRILNLASGSHPKAEYARLLLDEPLPDPPSALCFPSPQVEGEGSDIVQIAGDSVVGAEEPEIWAY